MAGEPRNRHRGSGQAGQGLMGLISNLLGAPPVLEGGAAMSGEEMFALGGQDAVIGASEPANRPLSVSKPNFFSKLQGGNQQYADLTNSIKLGEYENILRQDLVRQQLAGQGKNIQLRDQLDAVAREDAFKKALDEADVKDTLTRGLGRNTALRDQHVIPNTVAGLQGKTAIQELENAAYQTPDMQTAHVQNMFAGLEKQGLENKVTESKFLDSEMTRPTLGFMGVGSNAKVNPATGKTYMFQEPRDIAPAPGFEGGVREINLSPFRKVEGGLEGEQAGSGVSRGVPELLRRPAINPALPQFSFPTKPKMELPPGYEPYREAIERSNPAIQADQAPAPIIPQAATPMTPEAILPGMSQQDKILQFLRRPRPGMGMMNPFTIR